MILGKDQEGFFTNSLTLGTKCSVIRGSLYVDGDCMCHHAQRVLISVMGKERVHGGVDGGGLNKKVYSMAKYLRDSGF
uniref:Profilin n=1 Tax=Nannospalax galili TaxID=1026970 RepID=A0A8C6R4P2_NANGA